MIVIALAGSNMVEFETRLTASETRLMQFYPEETGMKDHFFTKASLDVSKIYKSPIEILEAKAVNASGRLSEAADDAPAEKKSPEFALSMVVISEKRKMAVINDRLLNEHDRLDRVRIARIEKDRVLLKSKESVWWEYLKETK